MARAKSALEGAGAGAATGAAFGPKGALIGGAIGGLYGLFAGGEDEKRQGWNRDASTWAMGQYGGLGQYVQGQGAAAQSMYAPVMGAANDYWRQMSQPSQTQAAWGNTMSRYYQPTQASGALSGYQTWAGNDRTMQNALGSAQGYLGQQTGLSRQLQTMPRGPSASEGLYGTMGAQYTQPTASGNYYDANRGQFSRTGQTQAMLQGGDYDTRGRAESLQLNPVGYLQSFAGENRQRMLSPSRIDQGAGEIGGLYRGANRTEGWSDQQLAGLGQKGQFEQFVDSTLADDNPYLERIRDKGNARLNQEMARRGSFKSGGAATQLGNYNAELDAQVFAQKADLARQAQGMGLERIGAGTGLAQAGDSGAMQRGGALSNLAGQRDDELRAREGVMLAAQEAASREALANNQMSLSQAQAADQTWLGRMSGKSGLAQSADQFTRSGQGLELQAAGQADSMRLRGLEGRFGAAGQADQARGADLERLLGYTSRDDAMGLSRAQFGQDAAQGTFDRELAKYSKGVDLGLATDQGERAQLADLLKAANLVDETQQGRSSSALDYLMQATGGNIDILMQILGAYGQTEGNRILAGGDAINAGADFYRPDAPPAPKPTFAPRQVQFPERANRGR